MKNNFLDTFRTSACTLVLVILVTFLSAQNSSYDSVYTERYMRKPQENAKGYDENSPINMTDNLSGRLFLIHGTADDNVHYQNTLEYVEQLVQSGKQFDMFV